MSVYALIDAGIILSLVALLLLRGGKQRYLTASAIFISYLGAFVATKEHNAAIMTFTLFVSGVLCVFAFTVLSQIIAYMYALRLVVVALHIAWIPLEWFWTFNNWIAWTQIVLAFLMLSDGGGRRVQDTFIPFMGANNARGNLRSVFPIEAKIYRKVSKRLFSDR